METITNVEELNILGYNLMYAGNPAEALPYFEQAEAADPNYIKTYINKGLCLAGLEDYAKAKENFAKAYKIDKKDKEVLSNLANICFLMGDFHEGIEFSNKLVELGLADADDYFHMALAWDQQGNSANAVRYYNKAIEIKPAEPTYYLRKSNCLVKARKFDDALQTLEVLNQHCPDAFESYHYSFLIYMQQGEHMKANAVIDAGLDLFPGDISLYYDKIRILSAVRQFDDALKLIKILEGIDGFEVEARNIKVEEAKIYMQTERVEDAVKALEAAVKMEGGHDFEAHYYLMNCYIALQDYANAERVAGIMMAADDNSAFARSAYYYLPMSMLKQGKPEAAQQYKASIQKLRMYSLKHPSELDVILFRALCHKDIKEYEKALEVLDYALKMKKDYSPAHAIKANVYKDMGNMAMYKSELDLAKNGDQALSTVLAEVGM